MTDNEHGGGCVAATMGGGRCWQVRALLRGCRRRGQERGGWPAMSRGVDQRGHRAGKWRGSDPGDRSGRWGCRLADHAAAAGLTHRRANPSAGTTPRLVEIESAGTSLHRAPTQWRTVQEREPPRRTSMPIPWRRGKTSSPRCGVRLQNAADKMPRELLGMATNPNVYVFDLVRADFHGGIFKDFDLVGTFT